MPRRKRKPPSDRIDEMPEKAFAENYWKVLEKISQGHSSNTAISLALKNDPSPFVTYSCESYLSTILKRFSEPYFNYIRGSRQEGVKGRPYKWILLPKGKDLIGRMQMKHKKNKRVGPRNFTTISHDELQESDYSLILVIKGYNKVIIGKWVDNDLVKVNQTDKFSRYSDSVRVLIKDVEINGEIISGDEVHSLLISYYRSEGNTGLSVREIFSKGSLFIYRGKSKEHFDTTKEVNETLDNLDMLLVAVCNILF